MSHDKTQFSLKPTARKLIAAAAAMCSNVILFWMVDALFAIDLSVLGGTGLS
jgi:hypothetical protein